MSNNAILKLFNLEDYKREPKVENNFYQKDILSVSQFTKDDLDYIFMRADEMAEMSRQWGTCDLLKRYTLACVYNPAQTSSSLSHMQH